MAIYPCDVHGGRYREQQQTIYPALVHGTDSVRMKRRACPECFAQTMDWLAKSLIPLDDSATMPLTGCTVCRRDVETACAVFVTAYAARSDREDWYGQVCAVCLPATEMALFGAQGQLWPSNGP